MHHEISDHPFISTMDEISYWIYTKRAPCLFSIDRVANKDGTDVFCPKSESVHSRVDDSSTPEKKRRKLSLLDEKSVSTAERQQNLYFDVSQTKIPHITKSEYKSYSVGSDNDFNVKKPLVQDKRRQTKIVKTSRTTFHKKNKLVTSTPKTTLRRSLRKARNCMNNNSQLNSSYEILNYNVRCNVRSHLEKTAEDKLSPIKIDTRVDQCISSKRHNNGFMKPTVAANNQYEDLSDVSGFTANYIRSTKIHSTKTQRKLKGKAANRNLMRESHHSLPREESRMIVCVNKAVNTGIPHTPTLDCSTDSSQNVLNSVTVKNNDRCRKVDKSTSELKFIDPKPKINTTADVMDTSKETIDNTEILFPSRTSRYPKRHKSNPTNSLTMIADKINSSNTIVLNKRRKVSKNSIQYDNSDRKENPEKNIISRTRSGRNSGLTLRQPENSVLVLSNSAEQVSSRASINVGSPQLREQQCDNKKQRKRVSARQLELKRSMDNCQSSRRESLRYRSGFAACFSDSEDSEPLKQKKFFC